MPLSPRERPIEAAATFSSRWRIEDVSGIAKMAGERARSHARATCAEGAAAGSEFRYSPLRLLVLTEVGSSEEYRKITLPVVSVFDPVVVAVALEAKGVACFSPRCTLR